MLNGRPMTLPQIAGQIGVPISQLKRLLDELIENGVARKNSEGVIYSKRMVGDEQIRNARAEGGKAGGEHGEKGASHGIKGGRPAMTKGGSLTPLDDASKPPPSSSSSSSSSSADQLLQQQQVITRTWTPSHSTLEDLQMVHGFALQWIDEQVPTFVAFWVEKNEPRISFNALFIDHCIARAKLRSVS
jgi:hypothetical protein